MLNKVPPFFRPQTDRLAELAKHFPYVIKEFETILDRKTHSYLDYANVRAWSEKLGWHVDLKRLHQLFDSFTCAHKLGFYYGTKEGDGESKKLIEICKAQGYEVTTKPVKKIQLRCGDQCEHADRYEQRRARVYFVEL